MRKFSLLNEYNQEFALNDVRTGFFDSPSGLGWAASYSYTRFGTAFIANEITESQPQIEGNLVFATGTPYTAKQAFIRFVRGAKKLVLKWTTTAGTYLKDVDLVEFKVSEIGEGNVLECPVKLMGKSLWYSPIVLTLQVGQEIEPEYNTLSGSVLNFSGATGDFDDVSAEIKPVQSGTGTPSPSNVRPISGWDEVKVTRTGKNLCNILDSTGVYGGVTYTASNGVITVDGTATANVYRGTSNIPLKAGTYTATNIGSTDTAEAYVLVSDTSTNPNSWIALANLSNGSPITFTIDHDIVAAVRVAVRNGKTVSNQVFKPMLVYGSDAPTEFESYKGTSYSVSLSSAGTVYGGSLDVTTGVLTVTDAIIDLGDLWWSYASSRFSCTITGLAPMTARTMPLVCSAYRVIDDGRALADVPDESVYNGSANIYIHDSRYTDATTFKSAVAGVKLVYKIATPQTYHLTPTEVSALTGTNTVFADTGDITLTYERANVETIWPIEFPAIWRALSSGQVDVSNDGSNPAAMQIVFYGAIANPVVVLEQDGEELARLEIPYTINAGEYIYYSSRDTDLYCYAVDTNGNETNLMPELSILNENFFKLPVGTSTLKFSADSAITAPIQTKVFREYKAV